MSKHRLFERPEHPSLLHIEGGFVAVTADSPIWWHFLWIKTAASILQGAYDKVKDTADRLKKYPKRQDEPDDEREDRNDDFSSVEYEFSRYRTLIREIESYMPHVRIPILNDPDADWRDGKMQDRKAFMAEMYEIIFQANRRLVKALEKAKKSPEWSKTDESRLQEVQATYTIKMAQLREMTGFEENRSLNKYAKKAGLPVAKQGKRDFGYTAQETERLLQTVIDNCDVESNRENCRKSLENLQKYPQKYPH